MFSWDLKNSAKMINDDKVKNIFLLIKKKKVLRWWYSSLSWTLCWFKVGSDLGLLTLLGISICTSYAHRNFAIFSHLKMQMCSSLLKLDKEHLWRSVFKLFWRFSKGFNLEFWLGDSKTFSYSLSEAIRVLTWLELLSRAWIVSSNYVFFFFLADSLQDIAWLPH